MGFIKEGPTAIEYGMIAALIGVAALSAMAGLGSQLEEGSRPTSETINLPSGCAAIEMATIESTYIRCPKGSTVSVSSDGTAVYYTPPPAEPETK